MLNRNKNLVDLSFNFNKISSKLSIHSSLNNISKQLNNISLNDVNILNLNCDPNRANSTNKAIPTRYKSHCRIYSSKSYQGYKLFHKYKPFLKNDSFEINTDFKIVKAISFSIIHTCKKNNEENLKKKNFILKENLKILLNELKSYRKNEQNNISAKEYESQKDYYINEIEKYQKEIMILKEKYISVIKENEELKKNINSKFRGLKTFRSINTISKTESNNSTLLKPNKLANLKSFKYLNLNIKDYIDKSRTIKRDKRSIANKSSGNINNTEMSFNNNNRLIEDKNSNKNTLKNTIKKNYAKNNSEYFYIKVMKNINNNFKNNNKNKTQNLNGNYKNNINLNQNYFKKTEIGNKLKSSNNKTLSKNGINKNPLNNYSFEINGSQNFSKLARNYKPENYKEFKKKRICLYKYNNYNYFNNHTLNEN